METYLAKVMYRIPERLFWIFTIHVYREGSVLVSADSPAEAHKKVKELKYYYYHDLLRTL
jgi:hypothetical protein